MRVPDVAFGEMLWAVTRGSIYAGCFLVALAVMPMYLFSATFFPVSRVPLIPRVVIELLPLSHSAAGTLIK